MTTATIEKVTIYDEVRQVTRTQWRIDLPNGRRKFTRTRREAREWCEEHGLEVTV